MERKMVCEKLVKVCFGGSLVLGLMTFAGCQNKFTHERWEMVRVGSADKFEVETTLGKPQEKPQKDLWWYYKGNREATIYFDAKDVVKAKKWFNTESGEKEVDPKGWIEK
jgi:hypothetical protein